MTFSFKKFKQRAERLDSEEMDFTSVFKVSADPDEIDSFISLRPPTYDPATLNEVSDVLDGDGNFIFDINYCIDMESAAKANIRKVKFEIYTRNPALPARSSTAGRPGTRTYINSKVFDVLGSRGTGIRGTGVGAAVSRADTRLGAATCEIDRSNTRELDRGLVKTFEVSTGMNDNIINKYRDTLRFNSTAARSPLGNISAGQLAAQSISLAMAPASQVYSITATPVIKFNTTTVGVCEQTIRGLVGDRPNSVDPRLAGRESFQDSRQLLGQKVLFSRKDPTGHLNMFYASGPSATGGSTREPIRYDGPPTVPNEVTVSRAGVDADNRFQSTKTAGVQTTTTQRPPNFRGNSAQEALYKKSADIALRSFTGSQFLGTAIRQINFRSSLRQFRAEFSVPMTSLRPKTNKYIWVIAKLIGRDGRTTRDRAYRIDVRKQLKAHITPQVPPSVRVLSQVEGRVVLELEQRDPLATNLTVYRMVARPSELSEATWTRVVDITANSRRGSIKFSDDTINYNVTPNIVLYEARCSGLFGSVCPTTTRIVESGAKRIVNLARSNKYGICNIVAAQVGNKIEIRVSRLPAGVTRVFLKKQLVNSALRERDFRKQATVRVQNFGPNSPTEYYDVTNADKTYVFEDNDVSNRQEYRYYAQFDWLDRERTNSVTEDHIEYRRIPERPIVSYLDSPSSGVDPLGRPFVSFELGASFADAGLDELNRILGENGVSSIFVEELRKDRALISNILLFQVTRRNTRTGESVVWPLVQEGTFTDNNETRASARGASGPGTDVSLKAGAQYLYTARLHIVNPERFFKEALTRIPASTRQIITDTDPNFIQVSAQKFAENFAIQPGTIQSPTSLERDVTFSDEVKGAYTGISYNTIVDIPSRPAIPKNVRTVRSAGSRPANVIKWQIDGTIDTVFTFEVSITIDRDRTFPLMGVSPTISEDGQYEVRDELFVHEITPISYSVTAIYNDMSRSPIVKSNEIYTATSIPLAILNLAVKKQITSTPNFDISLINSNTNISRQIEANVDPWVNSPLVSPDISGQAIVAQTQANRNNALSADRLNNLTNNNPSRGRRGF